MEKNLVLRIIPILLVLYSALLLIYGELGNIISNPALIATAISYNYPDSLSFVWNFWWYDYAVKNITNPFFSNLVFNPYGASLLLHTSTPLLSFFFAIVLHGISPVLKYNLSLLLIYFLNFICSYFCFNYLARDKFKASYLAGLLALSPYVFSHAVAGHLNLIAIFQVQLVFLFFFKIQEDASKNNISFFAISLFALPFLSLNYFYFFLLFTCFYFIIYYKQIKIYLKPYLLCFIFLTPYLYYILKSFKANTFTSNHNPEVHSADLFSFIFLNKYQLFNKIDFFAHNLMFPEATEGGLYIGYSLIALFLLCLKNSYRNKEMLLCSSFGFIFLILSLGPKIKVDGHILSNFSLYSVFEFLPAFPSVPARFYIFAFLFFLFAISISKISRKTLVILSLCCFMEYFPVYTKLFYELKDKSVLYQIRDNKNIKAIVDASDNEYGGMLRQTIHNKKIARAFIARKQKSTLHAYKHNHFLRMLESKKYNEKKLLSDYKELKVDGVLVSKVDNSKNYLRQILSLKYENKDYEFYSY